MKKISIMIPCWNEEENIRQITEAAKLELINSLPEYDLSLIHI